MKRTLLNILIILALTLSLSSAALAQDGARPDRPLPAAITDQKLSAPAEVADALTALKVEESLREADGPQQVVVRLAEPAVVKEADGGRRAQLNQLAKVQGQQQQLISLATSLDAGARVLGTAQKALNAVMLEIDADTLSALAANPAVVSIRPVVNYELDLTETVPYIGGTAVQDKGYDGSGIRVAVLDSGIDYLHFNLGGSGDPAEYAANDPAIIEPGSFPTAKVVGGYDFVGGEWTGAATTPPLMPDPDPLDAGSQGGHGTHVGDIIGGVNGVAPGASLYAVKVCSSESTSCSGVALIQGMDFAVDPNGDSDTSDHVDIINMSLGSPYGQAHDDDLSQAVENAAKIGVLTVASAGNSADKPYVAGSPSVAPSALSVAQTSVPSAVQPLMEILSPANIAGKYAAVHQPWSPPLTTLIEGPAQYGDGAGGNLLGCDPFAAGSLAGKIVLVDRGICNFTQKIKNISDAGALAGIIGLVAPGDPFEGGDGGHRPINIPGFMISQADSNTIKSGLSAGVTIRFDPAQGIPLVMHMVGSSSRGPAMLTNMVKPEIGAPGASVSAIYGTGTETGPFGGTSGAAPMVSGSAALLMEAFPNRSIYEIKALLMNTAETGIMNRPAFFGGDLASITRIGGGEVRVDRALASPAAAWDLESNSGALSFGFHDVSLKAIALKRIVVVQNYTNKLIRYQVSSNFRFADDAATGAVVLSTPKTIIVPPRGKVAFPVSMRIYGSKLRDWGLNSGSNGANPAPLTTNEYDGYITLTQLGKTTNSIHLAWHVLPRRAGNVALQPLPDGSALLANLGIGATTVEAYSLIGKSPDLPEGGLGEQSPTPDFRYLGYATFPVPADFCSANESFLLAFAINTWERQTHANAPASFWINLDTDQDGTDDYAVLSRDVSLNSLTDGRNLAWVVNLATGAANAFFFTDHETNSGNTVLYLCGEQIGMNAANFGQPINVTAFVDDVYFGGPGDQIPTLTIAPLGEKYLGVFDNGGVGSTTLPSGGTDRLEVIDTGSTTNNTETGLLLLYRGGAPAWNEAAIFEP